LTVSTLASPDNDTLGAYDLGRACLAYARHVAVADADNNRVRLVTPDREVLSLVGDGVTAGALASPWGLALARDARYAPIVGQRSDEGETGVKRSPWRPCAVSLLVSEMLGHRVVRVALRSHEETGAVALDSAGGDDDEAAIAALAGARGEPGFVDGAGDRARFSRPRGLARDARAGFEDTFYVADFGNHAVRVVDARTGAVATVAGDGAPGRVDGPARGRGRVARFHAPTDLVCTAAGVLYVADSANHAVRRIDLTAAEDARRVTTVAGWYPGGARESREGPGEPRTVDGVGNSARFNHPVGMCLDDDAPRVFISEHYGHCVRSMALPEEEVVAPG